MSCNGFSIVERPGKERRRGTTILEVMLAVLVLAVLAIAITTGLRYPRAEVVNAAYKQMAVHAANAALEEAFAMGYSSAALVDGTSQTIDDLGSRYSLHGRTVTVIRSVVDLNDGSSAPPKLITVTASYPGGDSPIELQTLLMPD